MSYVLDALRRAEADRHRGQVPDLHAPATIGTAAATSAGAGRSRAPWIVAALALLLALGAGALWWWERGSAAPLPPGLDAAAPEAEPVPARRPPPRAATPVPPPVALPDPAPVRRAAAPSREPAAPRAVPPPMSFGGAFDSPDPKARMLIINGQVWREGDEPAPGWVLERITLHSARFAHQGRSVEVPYDGSPARP